MSEQGKWHITGDELRKHGNRLFLYSWWQKLSDGWTKAEGKQIAEWIVENQDQPYFPSMPDDLVSTWSAHDHNSQAFKMFIDYIQANYPGLAEVMAGRTTLESYLGTNTKAVATVEFDLSNFQSAAQVYALLEQLKSVAGVKTEVKKA